MINKADTMYKSNQLNETSSYLRAQKHKCIFYSQHKLDKRRTVTIDIVGAAADEGTSCDVTTLPFKG